MYIPDEDTFRHLTQGGRMAPVYRELQADLDTPVSTFLKIAKKAPSFLLESVEQGEHLGRYSIIGTNPSLIIKAQDDVGTIHSNGKTDRFSLSHSYDPLHLIQDMLRRYSVTKIPGLPRFFGGAIGYLGYDTIRYFEKLPACPQDELKLPDAVCLLVQDLVIFDHIQHKMKVVSTASDYAEAKSRIDALLEDLSTPLPPDHQPQGKPSPAPEFTSNFSREEYEAMVLRAKEYILAGDIFQVVLSQRLRRQTTASSFGIYRALRMLNPSPYMFYLDYGPFQLIGSSPEMLVRLEEDRAENRPLAGTRPRGKTEAEDEALAAELLADPKEKAEHVMLVDLGRNDLGRVCRFGSVHVPLYMGLEKYSHVMHMVSYVLGKLAPGQDAFSLLRSCFPVGTV
ncbi:MAG: chorismate-binding protein, partial [Chloroflexota bacterium]